MATKDKRKVNDAFVTFECKFTDEQKEARKQAHDHQVTIFTGKPGTAKTFLAASIAIELLMHKGSEVQCPFNHVVSYKDINQIIITRPTVEAGESLGFLPGDIFDLESGKMGPYMAPVIGNMIDLVGQKKVAEWIEKGQIVTIPIQFLRGHTFKNCVVIADEAQNTTLEQFELLLTRIGHNSKVLISADWRQIDLKARNKSAAEAFEILADDPDITCVELETNFRTPLALRAMDKLRLLADKKKKEQDEQREARTRSRSNGVWGGQGSINTSFEDTGI